MTQNVVATAKVTTGLQLHKPDVAVCQVEVKKKKKFPEKKKKAKQIPSNGTYWLNLKKTFQIFLFSHYMQINV